MESHFRYSAEKLSDQETLTVASRKRKANSCNNLFELPVKCTSLPKCQTTAIVQKVKSPAEYALQVFQENGCNVRDLRLAIVTPTEPQILAYQTETVRAVQAGNVELLRKLHRSGVSLDCCNRFGESLISMACRRGNVHVVRFLVEEAKVSLMLRDDFGRNVLHDAFWTTVPKFELVHFLLEMVPDLLLVQDKRGHAPLNYIRREDWERWNEFLNERRPLLQLKLSQQDVVTLPCALIGDDCRSIQRARVSLGTVTDDADTKEDAPLYLT